MSSRALILFAHGARDPRWAEPFRRLQAILRAASPGTRVELAFLELMSPRLPELAAELAQDGCTGAVIVPVFFGQGGHVRRDLPAMADELRRQWPQLQLSVAPAVGEDEDVLKAIAACCLGQLVKDQEAFHQLPGA